MAPFQIEDNGLRFTAPFSPTEWTQLGKDLGREFREAMAHATSYCWIIGDWLVEGEKYGLVGHGRALKGEPKKPREKRTCACGRPEESGGLCYRCRREGKPTLAQKRATDRYKIAMKLTGLTESQLGNFYRTAKAFPIDVRVRGISFTKHSDAMVFPKDVRQHFLRQVLHEGWTSKRFRDAINKRELPPAVLEGAPVGRPTVPGRFTKAQTTNAVEHGMECPHCGQWIDRVTIKTRRVRKTDPIAKSA